MKVDINQKLIDFDGTIITNKEKDITLQDILISVSLADLDKEGKDKVKDFNIFIKIKENNKQEGNLDLTSEECVRLKEKIKQTHPTIIVGQVLELLEGKPNPIK